MENKKSHVPRNTDMLIAAETLFQQYRELVLAGFTEQQALYYLATSVSTLAFLKKQVKK